MSTASGDEQTVRNLAAFARDAAKRNRPVFSLDVVCLPEDGGGYTVDVDDALDRDGTVIAGLAYGDFAWPISSPKVLDPFMAPRGRVAGSMEELRVDKLLDWATSHPRGRRLINAVHARDTASPAPRSRADASGASRVRRPSPRTRQQQRAQ